MAKITVQNTNVTVISINETDYISLTDIAKHKSDDPTAVIGNWMRIEIPSNFWAFGKVYIIVNSTPSNSRGLKRMRA